MSSRWKASLNGEPDFLSIAAEKEREVFELITVCGLLRGALICTHERRDTFFTVEHLS